jgi:hypothetical protein
MANVQSSQSRVSRSASRTIWKRACLFRMSVWKIANIVVPLVPSSRFLLINLVSQLSIQFCPGQEMLLYPSIPICLGFPTFFSAVPSMDVAAFSLPHTHSWLIRTYATQFSRNACFEMASRHWKPHRDSMCMRRVNSCWVNAGHTMELTLRFT